MKTKPPQRSISPQELQRLCGNGAALDIVDVRTGPEFAAAHVHGAVCVPLLEISAQAVRAARRNPDSPVYLICQSGSRTTKAAEKLTGEGFQEFVVVEGGMDAWLAAGLPAERAQTRVVPLQRQVHMIVGLSTLAGAILALTVSEWFALLPLVTGCGLSINGFTGWCGLGLLLAKMPWNDTNSCSATGSH